MSYTEKLAKQRAATWNNNTGKDHTPKHIPADELFLSYVPKIIDPILEFMGTGILRVGHIGSLVAHIGYGKSQTSESIVASHLNQYGHSLGFRVSTIGDRPFLWIDGERSKDDIAAGFQRIKRRIVLENNPELITGDRFRNVFCYPFITYPSREARRKELERLITDIQPYFVLLDGYADFVYDINDTREVTEFIGLLVALANQYDCAIFGSIHPNPSQANDSKPRGVLGSELLRTSESVLLLKRAPDDRDTRILTMDFGHGKNRNAADNLESAFRWSAEHKMFLTCEYAAPARAGKTDSQAEAFTEILATGKLRYGDLVQALNITGRCKSEPTAKRWIAQATKAGLIFDDNGAYGLAPF